MPLPKRRHSSARQAKRRTHYKLTPPALGLCQRCKSTTRSHNICENCGYYNGRQWMAPKTTAEA